ncbi:MAG: hypothetical protein Q7R95_03420 [bacterium]|nr:hypothetical protein [bacterium]
MNKNDYLFKVCLDVWSKSNQEDMVIEEMSELTKAILKQRRKPSIENNNKILEEIADVDLMIDQMKYIYRRYKPEIYKIKQKKIDRLKGIINLYCQ